ncbi:MAG: DUF1552 domain-containing protein, partial [Pseudomonadota bacterium]
MIRRNGNDISSLIGSPRVAFEKLFCQPGDDDGGGSTPTPQVDYEKKVVDKVLTHYQSVINSNRLSTQDKMKLQQYIDNLNDLENRLFPERSISNTNPVQSVSACPARPTFQSVPLNGNSGMDQLMRNNIDVIALAIKSGVTNIATLQMHPHDYHASNFGDIHPTLNKDTHNGIGHSNGEEKWRLNPTLGFSLFGYSTSSNKLRTPQLAKHTFETHSCSGATTKAAITTPAITVTKICPYFWPDRLEEL